MKKSKPVGRPPKFAEARRPITVTLPLRTLQQLEAIHGDRAQAIVKATSASLGFKVLDRPLVEVVEAYPGQGVLIVGPSKRLKEIDFLRLVEIAPARNLLVIPTGVVIEALEVALVDKFDQLTPGEAYERELLGALLYVLRHHRRRKGVSKAEILLLQVDNKS